MMTGAESSKSWRRSRLRIATWGTVVFLLVFPVVAMQFTDDMSWDGTDFIVFGAMLVAACGTFELAARMTRNIAYRAAVGLSLVAAFLLIWVNLAVGIIGSEDNPANMMYGGVLAIGVVGSILSRFQPCGMTRTLIAMALAHAGVGVIALLFGLGSSGANWPQVVVVLNGFFAALWLGSAGLFWRAARERPPAASAP